MILTIGSTIQPTNRQNGSKRSYTSNNTRKMYSYQVSISSFVPMSYFMFLTLYYCSTKFLLWGKLFSLNCSMFFWMCSFQKNNFFLLFSPSLMRSSPTWRVPVLPTLFLSSLMFSSLTHYVPLEVKISGNFLFKLYYC